MVVSLLRSPPPPPPPLWFVSYCFFIALTRKNIHSRKHGYDRACRKINRECITFARTLKGTLEIHELCYVLRWVNDAKTAVTKHKLPAVNYYCQPIVCVVVYRYTVLLSCINILYADINMNKNI